MPKISRFAAGVVFTLAPFAFNAHAVQRAYVASYGADANATTSSCSLASPCRSFATAISVVQEGGEIMALDAAGYGSLFINKAVTITANPGVYAGITAGLGGIAVNIQSGGRIVLRGLHLHGTNAFAGISFNGQGGYTLSVERCVVSNFNLGILADGSGGSVRVIDSVIRDNEHGIFVRGGAIVNIERTRLLGNAQAGLHVEATSSGALSTVNVVDSVSSGNAYGIFAHATFVTSAAWVTVARSTISRNSVAGLHAQSSNGGTAAVTLSGSLVAGNAVGLAQLESGGGTATLESLGNNTIRGNATTSTGTIASASPM